MLRRARQIRVQIYQLKDATLFMLALLIAHFLRTHFNVPLSIFEGREAEPFGSFAWLYLIIFPGAPLILEWQGFYNRPYQSSRRLTAWVLFKSCALLTMGVILVMFLFKMALARLVIILFGIVSFGLVYLSEELLLWAYSSKFARTQMKSRVLLVGAQQDTGKLKKDIIALGHNDIIVAGELDLNERSTDDLVNLLHEVAPNTVVLTAKHTFFGQVEKAILACEREGVDVWMTADFFRTQIARTSFDDFCGRPVLIFRTAPEASWQGLAKQVLDISGALILVLLLAVPMLIVAILIKLTSPGPVLFRQQRCGLNGKPFTMLKFRSMVSDAEQRQHELHALNEMGGPVFKVTNDPRVTSIGRLLRRFSVDEVPQLFHVLSGEMSLVGPRPLPVSEVKRFDDPGHRRRLSVKPGLTCLWQISGRNNVNNFEDWVRLDLEYIDHWSFWLDLKILARTVPAVLLGTGAK